MTEFYFSGSNACLSASRNEVPLPTWKPNRRQARRLLQQASVCQEVCAAACEWGEGKISVMEVFSPPRFAPEVESRGFHARSYDLKTGYDLSTAKDRKRVEEDLLHDRPELSPLSTMYT